MMAADPSATKSMQSSYLMADGGRAARASSQYRRQKDANDGSQSPQHWLDLASRPAQGMMIARAALTES